MQALQRLEGLGVVGARLRTMHALATTPVAMPVLKAVDKRTASEEASCWVLELGLSVR